jgi:tRNA 2-thiouridine synthesizing protein C
VKKLLCVVSKPPYAGSHDFELLEAAMIGAVFEFSVSLLFRDEGAWALLDHQDGSQIGRRTVGKLLKALPTYEVEDLYVCADSLDARGLSTDDLACAVEPLTLEQQADLIAEQDAVIGAQS